MLRARRRRRRRHDSKALRHAAASLSFRRHFCRTLALSLLLSVTNSLGRSSTSDGGWRVCRQGRQPPPTGGALRQSVAVDGDFQQGRLARALTHRQVCCCQLMSRARARPHTRVAVATVQSKRAGRVQHARSAAQRAVSVQHTQIQAEFHRLRTAAVPVQPVAVESSRPRRRLLQLPLPQEPLDSRSSAVRSAGERRRCLKGSPPPHLAHSLLTARICSSNLSPNACSLLLFISRPSLQPGADTAVTTL